jgi:hypothetical protein
MYEYKVSLQFICECVFQNERLFKEEAISSQSECAVMIGFDPTNRYLDNLITCRTELVTSTWRASRHWCTDLMVTPSGSSWLVSVARARVPPFRPTLVTQSG